MRCKQSEFSTLFAILSRFRAVCLFAVVLLSIVCFLYYSDCKQVHKLLIYGYICDSLHYCLQCIWALFAIFMDINFNVNRNMWFFCQLSTLLSYCLQFVYLRVCNFHLYCFKCKQKSIEMLLFGIYPYMFVILFAFLFIVCLSELFAN